MTRTVLVTIAAMLFVAGCGGGGQLADRSSNVAEAIGADSCFATTYYLIQKADNSKMLIYSCDRNGRTICVTEQNGIASDSTEAVRFVFADSLTGKPSCVSG